ncbi:M56 family metallopeptidase [Spirosoma rhododendri]|uniref:Peptidase M56 domain-containing protein n=1 Tax=Spirosoma rhododendri TaxID=2728024 RepID=A0A7L5DQP9_9BACT|nr:M56 family metallopeptidase [Spirosoma rhododendri]QJD78858.1 hypothetical protein HH216_10770 [Spirosoma rhododendri]
MILYGLKSILILSVLAIAYKLLLETETMHRFKRVYLLASVLLAVVGPLLSFPVTVQSDFIPPTPLPASVVARIEPTRITLPADTAPSPPTDHSPDLWLLVYGAVTAVLLVRLVRNLVSIACRIRQHPAVRHAEATVILLPVATRPHTFLHYLFVGQADYEKQAVEPELFTHELTHIRQQHSVDILFAELISCFYWFNPALFFVRRAIRLNHEFLADQSVNTRHQNIIRYQQLLLSKLTPTKTVFLTSAFTFQTAKQRLIMMTKCTSPLRAGFTVGTAAILFMLLTLAAGLRSIAQVTKSASNKSTSTVTKAKAPSDSMTLEQRYSDKLVITWLANNKNNLKRRVMKRFSDLSEAEKKKVVFIPPQAAKTPTDEQFEDWKNPKRFGIWLDNKHIKNSDLNKYKPSDIASFWGSYVHKNARQLQGYLYQFDLMTHKEYERYLREKTESPFLFVADRAPRPKAVWVEPK